VLAVPGRYHRTMRIGRVAVLFLCLSAAMGQVPMGVIRGTITGPQGPVAQANISVLGSDGKLTQTISGNDGGYSLSLPSGTYDFFIAKVQQTGFTRRGIGLAAGAEMTIHATLSYGSQNALVPGENAFQFLSERQAPLSGPAPRTAAGVPDLSGVWLPGIGAVSDDPVYLPWAAKLQAERGPEGDPRAQCLPSGVVRTNGLELTKFVQTGSLLIILIEGSPPGFRQVFLDGRAHPANVEPSWMGHSVGRWEKDVLVIDTVGFHDRGWIDNAGKPQTEKLHVIERMHRTGLGTMEVEITVDDPGAYARPWKLRRVLKLAPEEELLEYVCNENNKAQHFTK
jgi:hypothetical protein